jgi:hypothetical protein
MAIMTSATLAILLNYAEEQERVCPRPIEWNELYTIVGGTRRDAPNGIIWTPMPPLVLSAWNFSNDVERKRRFNEHLAWADANGTIDIADAFLRSLSEEAWHHRSPASPRY